MKRYGDRCGAGRSQRVARGGWSLCDGVASCPVACLVCGAHLLEVGDSPNFYRQGDQWSVGYDGPPISWEEHMVPRPFGYRAPASGSAAEPDCG